MPKVLKDAVLAVEDARFYEHGGVDAKGLARAVLANLRHGTRQGASTITQQVARNVYLSSEQHANAQGSTRRCWPCGSRAS